MKKAKINTVKILEDNKVHYLDIPTRGNAPVLLLEYVSELGLRINRVENDTRYFRIHLNEKLSVLVGIKNYINNNL